MVCQRFIATNQVLSFRRQLRSKTSLDLSPPSADRTDSSLSLENLPSGKRNDVMITFTGTISSSSNRMKDGYDEPEQKILLEIRYLMTRENWTKK